MTSQPDYAERLAKRINTLFEHHFGVQVSRQELSNTIRDELDKELEELLSALEPLAKLDIDHLVLKPLDYRVYALNETVITVGDIRKASTLLAKYRP